MIDAKTLLNDLKKRVTLLENDLRERCTKNQDVDAPLKAEYESARANGRTGLTYNAWRDEEITQIAVAWILAGVFVRFLEDNELIEVPFLAGPNPERQRRAMDEQSLFFRHHPTASEREYFEHVFGEVGRLPGMKHFFDRKHNPLWRVGPSGDAAKSLLEFWRKTDPDSGSINHHFTDPDWNTRFLGDLYQDLSEFARKRYALLQTPIFVEQFILDRTLTPAIERFGFKLVRMIDPTCGSGHFLLGSFARLFRLWQENEPGENSIVLAQRALSQVYGVDLNPNVVAIARFRLLIAALRACEISELKHSPDFKLNIAAGDSLLHGSRFPGMLADERQQTFGEDELFEGEINHFYETEDKHSIHEILGQQYHVVVGNPPYITVKDKGLNAMYKRRFASCHRTYSLGVPFTERFFDLAIRGDTQKLAGFVGLITANSFMKREFGKKLVEEILPKWDVTHVLDTSGAYIPGHGTPTVIIFAQNRQPVRTVVRAAMGIRGEPSPPTNPEKGLVWTSIVTQLDMEGAENEYVTIAEIDRSTFHKHPWSIGGGGAVDLFQEIAEQCSTRLSKHAKIGIAGWPGIDEVMVFSDDCAKRLRLEQFALQPFVSGETLRDWLIQTQDVAIVPYSPDGKIYPVQKLPHVREFTWPYRIVLNSRVLVSGETMGEVGLEPWAWVRWNNDRMATVPKISFAFVATHNNFAMDSGGNVFNRSAPVVLIEQNESTGPILELLNSSTGCFWMKQVFHCKGGQGVNEGAKAELWERFYEFDGTKLKEFPIPDAFPQPHNARLPELVKIWRDLHPKPSVVTPNINIDGQSTGWRNCFDEMIALQEELDWASYFLYGLAAEDFVAPHTPPPVKLGERAFEISMARRINRGEPKTAWFDRHGSTPIVEIPSHWPEPYRKLVERRIELIESDRNIGLIEKSEYKRRWNIEPWDEQLKRALRDCLLNRLEGYFFEGERVCELKINFSPAEHGFSAAQRPTFASANQLAAVVEADVDFLRLAEIYSGGPGFSVSKLVRELVEGESVPFLPFQRYKENGLRKRHDWEHVWDLQRIEDAIDAAEGVDAPNITAAERELRKRKANERKKKEIGDIPVPPKYASVDFRNSTYWKLRGKLDVPKERWVIYPGAERDGDPSPMIAWAGWNHLQQAQALAAYYIDASQHQGWPAEKLRPLLAGLAELLPWLKQWHNEFNPEYSSGLGDYFAGFLDEEARKQGTTIEALNELRLRRTPST